jgi:hypothetical protein
VTAALPLPRPALLAAALALAACSSSTPTGGADAGTPDAGPPARTLVTRPLFGDTHPGNLLIDPNFSTRYGAGLGNWLAATGDQSAQRGPTFVSGLLSDAPAGIALPVARFADASTSTRHFQLDLIAQVPGGPGPYRLHVWVSTLDPAASAHLTGLQAGLLTSLGDQGGFSVDEDAAKAQVLGGRTWHLYTGDIDHELPMGGFVVLDFQASANTWLLQSPEFIPTALLPPEPEARAFHPPAKAHALTEHERALMRLYASQPRVSVPASHPAVNELDRQQLRR